MDLIFLQQQTAALPVPDEKMTFLDMLMMGGPVMIPIIALLFIAIYIFIERYLTIRKANKDPQELMRHVRDYIKAGEIDRARAYCEATNTPFARMVSKGINRLGGSLQDIAASIETEAKLEVARLEKSIFLLATAAGAAPMLGFLGTVMGIIKVFYTVSHAGNVTIEGIAGGMYEKMISSASGLFVGILAYISYNILVSMIEHVIFRMQATSIEFIDLLHEPVREKVI